MKRADEYRHRPVKAGGALFCEKCLVRWPCLEAHRAVTHCMVCGALWYVHTDHEWHFGCKRPAKVEA